MKEPDLSVSQLLNEINLLKKEVAFLKNKEKKQELPMELDELLSKSQEIAHIGSWCLNVIENKLSWTDEVYRIYGLEPQEFTPSYEAFLNVIHPEDRDKFDITYSASIKEGKDSYEIEHRIIRKHSQEVRFVREKCQHIRNKKKEIIRSVGMVQDITEEKKYFNVLQESELKYHQIADYNYDWEYWIKPNGEYAYISSACERISGYTPEEIMGQPALFFQMISPKYKAIVHHHFSHEHINSKEVSEMEFVILKKNGEECWIEHVCVPVFDENGNYDGRRGNNRDITEKKKAEQELIAAKNKAQKNEQEQKERIKELNGLYSLDLLAEKYEVIDDVYSKFLNDIVPKSMQFPNKTVALLKIENACYTNNQDFELTENKDCLSSGIRVFKEQIGELIVGYTEDLPFIDVYEQRLLDAYASKLSVIIEKDTILQDLKIQNEEYAVLNEELITSEEDIKRTNEELIIAKEKAEESDRLKSAFLSNMSHEIRTPMNGILGFTTLLQEPDLTTEEMKDYSAIIERSGARMLETINNIIDISQIEAGQIDIHLSSVNINTQIDNLYQFFKVEAENKDLRISIQKGLSNLNSIIITDDKKVYGTLTNLIKNAIKFTLHGSVEFGYNLKDNYLEFFVKDTGIGIPEDKQHSIFDRFIQVDLSLSSQYEGSGLGLSITKAYIYMLGGNLWVESKEGEGTTFYFSIPYQMTNGTQLGSQKSEKHLHDIDNSKKLNLLIADDDEAFRVYLQTLVYSKCKKIFMATNGIEVVEKCKNNADIDLILLDIKMPGLDGYEAAREIRSFNKNVIIFAQTAYALTGNREKALEAGCNEYITKPITKKVLFKLIQKHLKM
ncbi:MAG: hypothetical protein B7C24_01790 [Bacteroidetes bacterium 4572_77]|nr:MAG: hypothetical protein B7C24_01790 [Bacteroidetes bacterium 4572_77]